MKINTCKKNINKKTIKVILLSREDSAMIRPLSGILDTISRKIIHEHI